VLGNHRLACSDATSIDAVEKLMDGQKADMVFTDPPYGMFLDTAMSARQTTKGDWISKPKHYDKVIGDNEDFTPDLINSILATDAHEMFVFGADYFAELLPKKNDGSWIVWDKRAGVESMQWSTSEFELCWSKQKHHRKIARITWSGILGTEQEHDHATGRVHPTQKPVKLVKWFFENWGKAGDIVIDLFGGSGSTLLGCESTNRGCRMMELDPKYVDVIIKRFQEYTGKEAVLESTGQTFNSKIAV
jgi:DNA modification methylase